MAGSQIAQVKVEVHAIMHHLQFLGERVFARYLRFLQANPCAAVIRVTSAARRNAPDGRALRQGGVAPCRPSFRVPERSRDASYFALP